MKSRLSVGAFLVGALSACSLAPTYHEPTTQALPSTYSEAGEWERAQPSESLPRGAWWKLFRDDELDALERQVSDSIHRKSRLCGERALLKIEWSPLANMASQMRIRGKSQR